MKKKIYLISLALVWLFLSGRLFYMTYLDGGSGSYLSLASGLRELPSESEWMNIYLDGKKMGHTVYSIENQGANGYTIKSSSNLNVVFGGLESEIHLENTAVMDTSFRLEAFSFWMLSDQYSTHVQGQKYGTTMELEFIQGEDTTRTEITVPKDLYTYSAIQPMVASKGILEGQTIRVPAYDAMSNEMADVMITHEGKEIISVAGEKHLLNKLRIEFKSIPSIMWLDDNGITYKEETIMGMMMERTTPELALAKSDAGQVDLLNGFAVIPSYPISNSKRLKELKIGLSGVTADVLAGLSSERQKIVSIDPLVVSLSQVTTPLKPNELELNLRASDMVQSDHEQIRAKANQILGDESQAIAISHTLTQWVYNFLEKKPVASISGAVDILNTGVGDCTEHTTLYTALSRAAGVPTKIHIGLVYLQGRFLFHAWPVVAIDGEWVDVDPSLNQFPADATHIALVEGDFENLTNLIPVLGNVEIEILEQVY
ncbi:MAG: transglutaminase domain-containing protein [FCB group bacterium]|nr:transglutaminase domain-containing protein [FCB group bacterium]MBL7028733.1 transglutaminase domain-containing protein [Candidatus Neomarinimicrobiota bacterium]MBL7120663.1 transglutaminase domain-containing protein [Candidatus Neomarinimicrobiota bacterium]